MDFYLPILLEEIRLVDPDVIVTLGNSAWDDVARRSSSCARWYPPPLLVNERLFRVGDRFVISWPLPSAQYCAESLQPRIHDQAPGKGARQAEGKNLSDSGQVGFMIVTLVYFCVHAMRNLMSFFITWTRLRAASVFFYLNSWPK